MPEVFENQNFVVMQIEGTVRTDLGEKTGQQLYGFIRTQVGADRANQLEAELEKNSLVTVAYKNGFGQDSRYEIKRKA